MAISLKAILDLKDNFSNKVKKASDQAKKFEQNVNKASSKIKGVGDGASSAFGKVVGGATRALTSVQALVAGLGAVAGATKVISDSVSAAAEYEQTNKQLEAMFGNSKEATAFMDRIDQKAADSPLLNSGELASSMKGLYGSFGGDADQMMEAANVMEKLLAANPMQGTEGAGYALKQFMAGDALSMIDRFDLPPKALNEIKKIADPTEKIQALNKVLADQGWSDDVIKAMGDTTKGKAQQLDEMKDMFMRNMGKAANEKIGKFLGEVLDGLGKVDLNKLASEWGEKIGNMIGKIIEFGKYLYENRDKIKAFIGEILTIIEPYREVVQTAVKLASEIIVEILNLIIDNKDTIISVITTIGNVLTTLMNFVVSHWDTIKPILTGALVMILSLMVIAKFIPLIMMIFNVVNLLATGLRILIFVIQLLSIGFIKLTLSIIRMTIAMLASPLTWIVLGIMAIIAAIILCIVYWDEIKAVAIACWNSIKEALKSAWDWLVEVWGNFVQWMSDILTPVGEFFSDLWESVKTAFSGMWDAAVQFVSPITGIFDGVVEGIKTFVSWVGKAIDKLNIFKDKKSKTDLSTSDADGSNRFGRASVPYDGYTSVLHKGERVLTARENKAYTKQTQGGNDFGGGASATNQFYFNIDENSKAKNVAREVMDLIAKELEGVNA